MKMMAVVMVMVLLTMMREVVMVNAANDDG